MAGTQATTSEEAGGSRRLGWLRPPDGGPEGRMSLYDHLRELRYRVTISIGGIVLGALLCIFFYEALIDFFLAPWNKARAVLEANGATTEIVNTGVTQPFTLAVLVCVLGGVAISSPIWLWQIWAFVAPGLVAKEKKYALAFVGVSLPLFFAGAALGYYIWPTGIQVLLGFTPENQGITNLLDMANFLAMEIKVMLVFGAAFLLPVVVVGLNLAGVVRGYMLKKARKMVVFGSVVLAAVATPTTDPFSMLALAVPVTVMFLIAEAICRVWDRKRGITEETATEFSVDLEDGR